jgi:hypothetical protein
MATTTTNYGFDVPTSSDLVKNGATAISTLGQDLDTFLFRPFTRNAILNSGFNVWQRGTSLTGGGSQNYTADRWIGWRSGTTFARFATGDTTNLPNIQYCMRVQRNNGDSSTAAIFLSQPVETVNSIPFAGKTIIMSFYARKGALYSPTSSLLRAICTTGTGTDQNPLGGFTGGVDTVSDVTLTTTWQRFTFQIAVGATATQIATTFQMTATGTAGASDYFEVTGVQLEVGNQMTPYTPATPTYATELAACQRYFQCMTPTATFQDLIAGSSADSTSFCRYPYKFPVQMRVAPTLGTTGTASDYANLTATGAQTASAVPSISGSRVDGCRIDLNSGGITIGQGTTFRNRTNYPDTFLTFSAEL